MAFGGPGTLDEVEPFLRSLMEGRQVTGRQVDAVKERYRLIGGGSPLKSITLAQARALEAALNADGDRYRVFTGMRYTEPSIDLAVQGIVSAGIRDVTALAVSPYYNGASTGRYIQRLDEAVAGLAAAGRDLRVRTIKGYNTNPFFIEAVRQRLIQALGAPDTADAPYVIFSAHSLPVAMAEADGYPEQLEQTLKLVLKDLSLSRYAAAFQSKGMTADTPWLGPDVKDVMDRAKKQGEKRVLIVPYGFVSDHVETLYDIDVVYKRHAATIGLGFSRAESLNASDLFIAALKDVVVKAGSNSLSPS